MVIVYYTKNTEPTTDSNDVYINTDSDTTNSTYIDDTDSDTTNPIYTVIEELELEQVEPEKEPDPLPIYHRPYKIPRYSPPPKPKPIRKINTRHLSQRYD